MSTPIELVKALIERRGKPSEIAYDEATTTALALVLRDAERFKALERAHGNPGVNQGWAYYHEGSESWDIAGLMPLSELADRLREENK